MQERGFWAHSVPLSNLADAKSAGQISSKYQRRILIPAFLMNA